MEPNQPPAIKPKYQNPDLQDQIEGILQSQSPKDALKLLQRLSEMENAGSFNDLLKDQQQRLRVVAISLLPVSKLLSLFQGKLGAVLEFNVSERLKSRFVSMPTEEQDDLKNNIFEALRTNEYRFVDGKIYTPAQWIKNYRDTKQTVDAFTKGSDDFNRLSIEGQLKVQRLLQSINLVTTSSESLEGMQDELLVRDEMGKFRVLRGGELVDLGVDTDVTESIQTKPIQPAQPLQVTPTTPLPPEPKVMQENNNRPALAPPPPAIVKPSASFFFNTDDETEVQQHRTRLADIEPHSGADLEDVVKQLVQKYELSFSDKMIEERFYSIIKSRLRDVRDLIETKNMLTRPAEVGGVGLPESQVMSLLSQLEEDVLTVHQKPIAPPPPPEPKPVPTPTPESVKPIPELPIVPPSKPEPPKPEPPEPVPPNPFTVKKTPKPMEEIPVVKRPPVSIRPTVSDIKPPMKTVGPIEELAELKLQDYRRLGDIEEANEKIMEKLSLLEEDSYLKRAEGVKAWKRSEVYKVYLNIGLESMEKDMAVTDIIRQRKEDGRPHLTKEEFQAVADLNKKISF